MKQLQYVIIEQFHFKATQKSVFPWMGEMKRTGYLIMMKDKKGFRGYVRRQDGELRKLYSRAGARKAIHRELTGDYHG
jgi:hypothetical protein